MLDLNYALFLFNFIHPKGISRCCNLHFVPKPTSKSRTHWNWQTEKKDNSIELSSILSSTNREYQESYVYIFRWREQKLEKKIMRNVKWIKKPKKYTQLARKKELKAKYWIMMNGRIKIHSHARKFKYEFNGKS